MTTYGRLILSNAEPALVAGAPQSGATLTVYLTGTTTLADLFSDQGVTPILNPQTSNSAGLFYAQSTVIFADDSVAYDALLAMPNGTSYTYDNLFLLGPSAVTSGFAPLNSPAFTGTPTAPTPAANDDSTKLATTAFVAQAVGTSAITYAQFRNQQPSGTLSGESISNATWTARTLNTTVFNTIAGSSLVSNQIILPAGTYECTASGSATTTGSGLTLNIKLRVRNITGSTTLISGQNQFFSAPSALNGALCVLQGQFTLGGTTTIELDEWVVVGSGTVTGGSITSSGDPEVYCDIYLRKVA